MKSYACNPEESKGRLYPEKETRERTCFQRDRDRIIHSSAFRRLKYKTQVFVYHEGENYRTRLSHSLEVAQVARTISRRLGLNEDLAESLALAHDLGHTPFGHAGERALKKCMKEYRGFDHNAQSLRIVTALEQRYAEFDGLNLTWETLEGLVKHNGPLIDSSVSKPLPMAIKKYSEVNDLELDSYPSLEAQIASISDDVAYNSHDFDDGLHAWLFDIKDIMEVPLVGDMVSEVNSLYPNLERSRLIHEIIRRLIAVMIDDVVDETRLRLNNEKPSSVEDVRKCKKPLVGFSDEMSKNDKAFKNFLFPNMYRHYKVNRMTSKAERILKDLFELLVSDIKLLPDDWRQRAGNEPNTQKSARVVCDYIAGMTDKFALDEHARLFDPRVKI